MSEITGFDAMRSELQRSQAGFQHASQRIQQHSSQHIRQHVVGSLWLAVFVCFSSPEAS
jgi:hypothetical protein